MNLHLVVTTFIGGLFFTAAQSVPTTAQPSKVTAELELRIGALGGAYAFGSVEAVTADRYGRVYVLESDMHRARVFDRDGRLRHTLGREGHGPGELDSPVGLAWESDTLLWIIDPGNNRASVFCSNGAYVGDRLLPSAFALAPWPGRFDRSGNLLHYAPAKSGDEFAYVMVKYDSQMVPLDTIIPPTPPAPIEVFETRTERYGVVRASVPFAPKLIWRLDSGAKVWWSWTANFAIYTGADAATPIITSSHSGPRVTGADRAAAIEGLRRFRQVGGRVDQSRIPDKKPALRTFFLDDEDQVWVMPELPNEQTGRRLDWFDGDGKHLGSVALPIRLSSAPPPVMRGGRLYGVEHDELGVPYVVVIRVSSS